MAGDPTRPKDAGLIELEEIFGVDFINLPTTAEELLPLKIEQGLYKIFGIEVIDFSSLTEAEDDEDPAFSDSKANEIIAKAQSPYKALAYLLAALTTRPPPVEGGDEEEGSS